MSDVSPKLSLPYIMPAQAQKHVTHNEALEMLDVISQLTLESVNASSPPGSPVEGQSWGLSAAPTGDWAGEAGKIAAYRGGGWLFLTPGEGWRAWVVDAQELQVMTGGAWTVLATI